MLNHDEFDIKLCKEKRRLQGYMTTFICTVLLLLLVKSRRGTYPHFHQSTQVWKI